MSRAAPDGGDATGIWRNATIHRCVLPGAEGLNAEILEAFRTLGPADFQRRTHYVGGRYENLYLDPGRIPALGTVIGHALECAARVLARASAELRCGFWLNAMEPGQGTSEHTHSEADELLAGVYYVETPEDSGDLLLYDGPLAIRIPPRAGSLLLFPPDLRHAVETNRSPWLRLAVGINFGPRAAH